MKRNVCRLNWTSPKRLLVSSVVAAVTVFATAITVPAYATANHLPDITLADQNSTPIALASLRGRPVLVGFIHTTCKGVCQMMTHKMRAVESALPATTSADVTMLLITTDPTDDHPPQLLQYARNQDLPKKGWILATGSPADIKRVMSIYGVSHEDTDDAMMHVMKLFLIAPDGSLAHIYPGMKTSPQTVAADISKLTLKESAADSMRR